MYLNFRFTQMNDVYCVNIQCIHMNLRRMTLLHVMNYRLNTSSCVFLFVSLFFIFLPFVFVFFVCLVFWGFFQQSIFHLWPNLDTPPPFPLKNNWIKTSTCFEGRIVSALSSSSTHDCKRSIKFLSWAQFVIGFIKGVLNAFLICKAA